MINNIRKIRHIRPICFYKVGDEDYLLCSRGYSLFQVNCKSLKVSFLCSYYLGVKSFISRLSLLRRVLRLGFSSAILVDKRFIVLSDKNNFYLFDIEKNDISILFEDMNVVPPLTLNQNQDPSRFYYGEYVKVGSGIAPSVYSINQNLTIDRVFTFPAETVDHIHYVYYWESKGVLIILTGDFLKTIGVWIYDLNTSGLKPLYIDGQSSRFCWIFFENELFFAATDSQFEPNKLKSLNINAENMLVLDIKNLSAISGSSIYACEDLNHLYFSTAVEPGMPKGNFIQDMLSRERGSGILDDYSRIYAFSKCNSKPLEEILSAKKDIIPPRLGQFGTFTFPSGQNLSNYLFAYGVAVQDFDDCLIRVDREF